MTIAIQFLDAIDASTTDDENKSRADINEVIDHYQSSKAMVTAIYNGTTTCMTFRDGSAAILQDESRIAIEPEHAATLIASNVEQLLLEKRSNG